MAEESDVNEVLMTEERDDFYMGGWGGQPFVLLLKVTQSNGGFRWVYRWSNVTNAT